jgi:hypothetical protein
VQNEKYKTLYDFIYITAFWRNWVFWRKIVAVVLNTVEICHRRCSLNVNIFSPLYRHLKTALPVIAHLSKWGFLIGVKFSAKHYKNVYENHHKWKLHVYLWRAFLVCCCIIQTAVDYYQTRSKMELENGDIVYSYMIIFYIWFPSQTSVRIYSMSS